MTSYPPELEQFVQSQVSSGRFASRMEFEIAAALHFMEYDSARNRMKAEVQAAIDEIEHDQEEPFDIEELKRDLRERVDEQGRPLQ